MKALFTNFHMLYCLSQNFKYFLRYGRMTIAVWELSLDSSPLFPSVDLRGAITQRPERQFTSRLVCAKALFLVFHGHQSACELSLWSLSYSRSTVPRDSFSPRGQFHELAKVCSSVPVYSCAARRLRTSHDGPG